MRFRLLSVFLTATTLCIAQETPPGEHSQELSLALEFVRARVWKQIKGEEKPDSLLAPGRSEYRFYPKTYKLVSKDEGGVVRKNGIRVTVSAAKTQEISSLEDFIVDSGRKMMVTLEHVREALKPSYPEQCGYYAICLMRMAASRNVPGRFRRTPLPLERMMGGIPTKVAGIPNIVVRGGFDSRELEWKEGLWEWISPWPIGGSRHLHRVLVIASKDEEALATAIYYLEEDSQRGYLGTLEPVEASDRIPGPTLVSPSQVLRAVVKEHGLETKITVGQDTHGAVLSLGPNPAYRMVSARATFLGLEGYLKKDIFRLLKAIEAGSPLLQIVELDLGTQEPCDPWWDVRSSDVWRPTGWGLRVAQLEPRAGGSPANSAPTHTSLRLLTYGVLPSASTTLSHFFMRVATVTFDRNHRFRLLRLRLMEDRLRFDVQVDSMRTLDRLREELSKSWDRKSVHLRFVHGVEKGKHTCRNNEIQLIRLP